MPPTGERGPADRMSPNCEIELLFTSPTSEETVCHCLILRNNDFITCGPRRCDFWMSDDGGGSQIRQGQLPTTWISVPLPTEEPQSQEEIQEEEEDNNPPAMHFTQVCTAFVYMFEILFIITFGTPFFDKQKFPFLFIFFFFFSSKAGGVFHRTVGRRVVTCLAESPPPSGFGLMRSEMDGRVVAGCGSTASGGSGDLIMWRVNDRQCTGAVRAHLGHVLSVDWCEGDPDYGMYSRTCKTPGTANTDGQGNPM